jgi:DNA-directed RNA polymerase subunit beta'
MGSQVDNLYGLKENVIVGKLIPAGTGVKSYRQRYLGNDVSELEQQARKQEYEPNDVQQQQQQAAAPAA